MVYFDCSVIIARQQGVWTIIGTVIQLAHLNIGLNRPNFQGSSIFRFPEKRENLKIRSQMSLTRNDQ